MDYRCFHSNIPCIPFLLAGFSGLWNVKSRVLGFFLCFFTWSQVFWMAYPEWETFMSLLWFNSFKFIPPSFWIKQSRTLVQTTAFCCGAHSWGLYSYSTKMICSSVGRSLSEVFSQSLQTMPWWGELSWVERTDHQQRVHSHHSRPGFEYPPTHTHFLFLSSKYNKVQLETYFCLKCEHIDTQMIKQ